jgi:serine protease Do
MYRLLILSLMACFVLSGWAAGQTREEKVRDDRKKVEADRFWIYNDLARGMAEAKETGRPLIVTLRCIPCVECVKLDDDLVNKDKRVRPLLEKFVRVRLVSTNGLDLSLFQYDYDQSFAAFLLNADGTIYGRFGTRSHRTSWADDVSIEGLAKALQGALELHEQYPKNKRALAAKTGPAPDYPSPEKYPLLRDKYRSQLATEGPVVPSCIHCHQIGDAQRGLHHSRKKAMPDEVLFPYPHPKIVGLILDPKERAKVLRVEKDSLAAKAGFQEGDAIASLEGQPLLSIADVQWVLHRASPEGQTLKAEVRRGQRTVELKLELPRDWRQRDDISWRATSWGLRGMATGGMLLETLPAEDRKKAGLEDGDMALRVKYAGGGNGPRGAALKAGFRQGDVLVSIDDRKNLGRETDLIAYVLKNRKVGDTMDVTVLRGGKRMELKLPVPE